MSSARDRNRVIAVAAAVVVAGAAYLWTSSRRSSEDENQGAQNAQDARVTRTTASKTAMQALKADYVGGLFSLASEARKNGGRIEVPLGDRTVTLLSSFDDCKAVLKESKAHALGAILRATETFIGSRALFCLESLDWETHRKVFVEALTLNDQVLYGIESAAVKLARRLGDVCKKHQPMTIEMNNMLSLYHMACVLKGLTGNDLNALDGDFDLTKADLPFECRSKSVENFRNALEFLLEELPRRATSTDPSAREDYETHNELNEPWHLHSRNVKKLARKACEKAFSGVSNSRDLFVDRILAEGHDQEAVAEKVAEALFAGYNTSVVSMGFMLFYLAQNPACYPKALREVDSAFANDRPGSRLDLTAESFPFLLKVFKEATRLVPPQPMTARHLEKEISLPFSQTTLPKGTHVWIPIVALGQDPIDWGADASLFKPERFSNDNDDVNEPHRGHLPFSFGPRRCPGERYAEIECVVGCAILLRFFTFDVARGSRQAPFFTGFGIRPYQASEGKVALKLTVRRR